MAALGLMAAVSGPSMLIAALKLRQRNLGPILDANGWAVNGCVRIAPFSSAVCVFCFSGIAVFSFSLA